MVTSDFAAYTTYPRQNNEGQRWAMRRLRLLCFISMPYSSSNRPSCSSIFQTIQTFSFALVDRFPSLQFEPSGIISCCSGHLPYNPIEKSSSTEGESHGRSSTGVVLQSSRNEFKHRRRVPQPKLNGRETSRLGL